MTRALSASDPLQDHGAHPGDPLQDHGAHPGDPLQDHGAHPGDPLQDHGARPRDPLQDHGAHLKAAEVFYLQGKELSKVGAEENRCSGQHSLWTHRQLRS